MRRDSGGGRRAARGGDRAVAAARGGRHQLSEAIAVRAALAPETWAALAAQLGVLGLGATTDARRRCATR